MKKIRMIKKKREKKKKPTTMIRIMKIKLKNDIFSKLIYLLVYL